MKVQRFREYDCFFCDKCRDYVYDEKAGDVIRSIPPRTRVENLADDWFCPKCGADRTCLRASTLPDDFLSAEEKTIIAPKSEQSTQCK